MAFPYFTAAAAAVLAVLQMLLLLYTALGRGKYKVGLGDGDNAALLKRIRMHGNLAENLPLFLIMLGLTEMTGQWAAFVPWIAIAFVVVRLSHIIGLAIGEGANPFRFIGGAGTIAVVLVLVRLLGGTLLGDTHWMSPVMHG
jgi:uncharacterized membrane protein YecN with MAPEG domain